jgi:transposase
MGRHEISDKMWALIKPLIPKQGSSNDDRLFINAVVYQNKTGIQWRDMPERFGKWNSVYQRFNRWSKSGIWEKIFELTADGEPLILAIDSTSIRANQVAAGQKKRKQDQTVLVVQEGG